MVVYSFSSRIWEAEAAGSSQRQPGLHSEFQASQGCVLTFNLNNTKPKKQAEAVPQSSQYRGANPLGFAKAIFEFQLCLLSFLLVFVSRQSFSV